MPLTQESPRATIASVVSGESRFSSTRASIPVADSCGNDRSTRARSYGSRWRKSSTSPTATQTSTSAPHCSCTAPEEFCERRRVVNQQDSSHGGVVSVLLSVSLSGSGNHHGASVYRLPHRKPAAGRIRLKIERCRSSRVLSVGFPWSQISNELFDQFGEQRVDLRHHCAVPAFRPAVGIGDVVIG